MYQIIFVIFCLIGHVEAKCLANIPPQDATSTAVETTTTAGSCTNSCVNSGVVVSNDTNVSPVLRLFVLGGGCETGCILNAKCGTMSMTVELASGTVQLYYETDHPFVTYIFKCQDNGLWQTENENLKNIKQFTCSYKPTGC